MRGKREQKTKGIGKGNGAGGIALTTTPDFDVVGGGISFWLGVGSPIDIS